MARSRSALLTLAAIAALAEVIEHPRGLQTHRVLCVRPARQCAGRRARGCAGPARGAALYRAAGRSRRHSKIQSIFQRERIPRLAHARRPHAHQLALAQPATAGHSQTARKRGGIHNPSAADRLRDRGGGVLAVRQLLVAGAGGRAGGRLTRGGGRVHARVAPAVRGRQRVARGLAVPRAGAARARAAARRGAPVPRRLPRPRLRHPTTTRFLTGVFAPLLSAARED